MRENKHETRAKKAKLAISYITTGTLMVVWSIVWLLYLTLPGEVSGSVYIASGIIASGIAVVAIGLKVGEIGREANTDEPEIQTPVTTPSVTTRKTDPTVRTEPYEPQQPGVAQDVVLETRKTAAW